MLPELGACPGDRPYSGRLLDASGEGVAPSSLPGCVAVHFQAVDCNRPRLASRAEAELGLGRRSAVLPNPGLRLLCFKCYLEACYLISKYLGGFQLSFCY